MLKREFKHLTTPEDVDAATTLNGEQKAMLKSFLLHVDYVANEPSEMDKKKLADAYYEGNNLFWH